MKPILFIDFYGTLSQDYFWRSLDSGSRKIINDYLFSEPNLATRDWMKGIYSSEEINRLIAHKLGLNYEELWEAFVDDCKSMTIFSENLPLINELRMKYHTVLLTDNMDCFTRFVVPALGLGHYFDYIASSSDEKILKNENEGEAFLRHILRINSTSHTSILIDDSTSACTLFEKLGGTSYLVTKEQSLYFWLQRLI